MSDGRLPLPDGAPLQERFLRIEAQLSTPLSESERAALKLEIVELFREAAHAAERFMRFKDDVKALASRWKHGDAPPAPRPKMTGRVDHLGASTYVEKAWSRLSLGDAAGAETASRRALELAPDDNDADCLLGWAQMHQQRYDEALQTCQRVLERDPAHALARANVGYVCLRKKIYGESIEHLSRAIRANTDRKATLYAHLYLGMVYREREMYDDALLFFGRALELGPNLLEAWYETGRAHWFAGDRDAARRAWRHGADANKFNPWGKRCAEMLIVVEEGGAPPRTD